MLFRAHSKQNLCPTSWHFCDEILISQVTGVSTHHGRPICRVGAWLPGLTKPVRRRVPARPPMGTGRLVSAPCSLKQQCDSGRNLVWRAVAPRLQGGGGCSCRIGSPFHWWTPVRVVFDCCEEFARAESDARHAHARYAVRGSVVGALLCSTRLGCQCSFLRCHSLSASCSVREYFLARSLPGQQSDSKI